MAPFRPQLPCGLFFGENAMKPSLGRTVLIYERRAAVRQHLDVDAGKRAFGFGGIVARPDVRDDAGMNMTAVKTFVCVDQTSVYLFEAPPDVDKFPYACWWPPRVEAEDANATI
jgi:hypothetical protein